MPLQPGSRLGPYEVLAPLGAGGMGEVYRARDPRLGREVAIKVLPDALRTDPDRLRRFEQEARAAGALNHPNVLVVLDVGTHDGVPYVVSEMLQGETLRERLRVGGLTPSKAVECAVQIAQGLAAAHEKGITHRDLKPENLFLTRDGRVKILDFGLAKLREPGAGGQGASEVPTLSHGTEPGAILGTVGYMSPEQVRGFPADHRSDIFSFGAVLYEMLSRRRAFEGESSPEVLTAILKEDPPELASSERNLPPALGRIVRRCLEKNPEDRFHSAHDLGLALEAVTGQTVAETRASASASPRHRLGRAILLAAALVLVGAPAFIVGKRAGRAAPPEFHRLTFRRGRIATARFAPDGTSVVYGADWEGASLEVYSQRVGALEARPLGMSNLSLAAVGPGELAVKEPEDNLDTLSVVPFEGGGLRRVVDHVAWADWSSDGRMAVSRAANGREWIEFPVGRTVWETTVGGVAGLRVSPDGRHVAFMEQTRANDLDIAISVVNDAGRKATLSAGWVWEWPSLAWSPDGREVWFGAARRGSASTLHAVSLEGQERLVLSVGVDLRLSDISRDGRVLLAEVERRNEVRGAPDGIHEQGFAWLDGTTLGGMSADGKRLLFSELWMASRGGYAALYVRTLTSPTPTRLGEGQGIGFSPDGAWVLAYDETLDGRGRLSLVPTGVGETRHLPRGNLQEITSGGWFPDGRRILVAGNEPGRPGRLFAQEVPDGLPRPLTPEGTSPVPGPGSMVSPDGRLVAAAYTSETPAPSFALSPTAGGAAIPIPGIGGDQPLCWSSDGRFLYVQGGWLPLRIQRLDLRTGRKQLWKELRPPDPTGTRFHSTVLAPDGGAYFYEYGRHLSTLYVVDGLR
jgi:hypothetical protein